VFRPVNLIFITLFGVYRTRVNSFNDVKSGDADLEQVEDLLAEVQLKVGVVGARHVVDEHQAIPLGLKAVGDTSPLTRGRS